MTAPLTASIVELALGLVLDSADAAAGNRCTLEGLALSPGPDGVIALRAKKLAASALRLSAGPLVMEVGRIAVRELAATVRAEGGAMRLCAVDAAEVEFSGVKLHGPLVVPAAIRHVWHTAHVADGPAAPPARGRASTSGPPGSRPNPDLEVPPARGLLTRRRSIAMRHRLRRRLDEEQHGARHERGECEQHAEAEGVDQPRSAGGTQQK